MKTISFIELCEMIRDGNAPKTIKNDWREYIFDKDDYFSINQQTLTDDYQLSELMQMVFTIPTEPLLTDKEKAYLGAVIGPWKEVVLHITKSFKPNIEWICITTKTSQNSVYLPTFEKDKYYKGLELDKEYSLEELEL